MMDYRLLLLSQLVVLFYGAQSQSYLNAGQRLNAFKKSYNDSQSDIIIFLDVSGSVSDYGFYAEKYFVSSLFNEFSMAYYSTRVAIITFGERVKTDVNFISLEGKKTEDTTKCEFKTFFEHHVNHRKERATNMKIAFRHGHDLLKEAERQGWKRNNVNTVAFMITDGAWNMGDPTGEASSLKSSKYHVDIFSIGVDGARYWQLNALASSNDKVIYANNFEKFRQLAKYIRGDAHEREYLQVSGKRCASACHSKASCTCGTVGGRYVCSCFAGYSGNGINCTPCPKGSYKDFPSPEKCKACPKNSNTAGTGSKSIDDCQCKSGFEGKPKKNIECTRVKCSPIAAPENGKMTGANCKSLYQGKCFFECNNGYLRDGPPFRECLANKEWSGKVVRCDVLKCNDIPKLHHGSVYCSGNKFQDKCTFTCNRGYELIGSSKKNCQANGQWTGSEDVRCEAKKCPVLRTLSYGKVEPVDCVQRPQHFGAGCIFKCNRGYTMQGEGNLFCKEDGTWNKDIPSCKDTEPPEIKCPRSITMTTDTEKPIATVTFPSPVISDNSQLFSNTEIKVQQSPAGITSPYPFPLGSTTVQYIVEDKEGNINRCSFSVFVEDKEKPRKISCPKSKVVTMNKGTKIAVSWDPVIFKDNCGNENLNIFQSAKNNSLFSKGNHVITYTAMDKAKNMATCQFAIRVQGSMCKYYPPPVNGGTIETELLGGSMVTPSCSKGFDFATKPSQFYQCLEDGMWLTWPTPNSMPWPDCTGQYNADALKGFEFQYFTGDCRDPKVQLEAKNAFLIAFNGFLVDFYPDFCAIEKSCTVDNVFVECGTRQADGKRRKRGIAGKTIFIDLKLKFENKNGKPMEALKKDLDNVANDVTKATKLKQLKTSSETLNYEGVRVDPAEISCRNGSVYGMNQDKKDKCQSCPTGTYFNLEKKSCHDCPKDTYQEEFGRFHCNKCPAATFTNSAKTKNLTECREKCLAGEYSENGLQNCLSCSIGFYQHVEGSKHCIKCPGLTTTTDVGAKSINECGVPCAAGTFSGTGVEPCELCHVGNYQTSSNKKKCLKCPQGHTTTGRGATSATECQVLNPCYLSPCNNGGECKATRNIYECVCKPGYQGKHCETEINECESSPCYKGATCLDKVNSYVCICPPGQTGKHCDQKVGSFCSINPCSSNGVCLEEPDGFICNCKAGFTGVFCESEINECSSNPCENKGKCSDLQPGYKCECKTGYTGVRCQINKDGCASDPCVNDGQCVSLGQDFQCNCQAGFRGKRCEVNINDCASGPCKNNGKCVDGINDYECACERNFGGKNCEIEQPMDYDLLFKQDIGVGSSILKLKDDIKAFTVAFWMKAAEPDNSDPGTPLSYAVEHAGKLYDNALTIHDYTGFDVFINNERFETNVDGNDGKWHHIAVSWESATGIIIFYKDGSAVSQDVIQRDKVIYGGGLLVLGQEQDSVGGEFTASEAFYGHISQVNMWDSVLSNNDIQKLASHCAFEKYGNLIAWGDFLNGLDGGSKKIQPSQACQENRCWSNWMNGDNPQSGSGDFESTSSICSNPTSYDCQKVNGYSLKNVDVNKTICTAQGIRCQNVDQKTICPDFKVRVVCPCSVSSICTPNKCQNGGTCINRIHGYQCKCQQGYTGDHCETELHCGDPRPFAHGTVSGTTFSPGRYVTFTCDANFKLVGSSSLLCRKGHWQGIVPRCEDINECQQGRCSQQVCANTLGGYSCSCGNGYRQQNGKCEDINECLTNKGNCQGQCVNNIGSYRCLCGAGTKLTKDGLKCEDINECAHNGGRGPCDHFCENTFGGYNCKCRQGFTRDRDGCIASSCARLYAPVHGKKIPAIDVKNIDSEVTFSCNVNYKLVGSRSRTCLVDGTWSGNAAVCSQTRCHPAPVLLNGRRSNTNNHAGAQVTYRCNSGYKLVGNSTLRCQLDQEWSAPAPRCIRTDCPEPSSPSNGNVFGSQSTIGSTIRYECFVGYTFVNNAKTYAECSSNKQWSNPRPTCQMVNCGDPGGVSNGRKSGNSFTYTSIVTYTCDTGYRISGSERRTCQKDGRWSGIQPQCSVQSCGDPGIPVKGEKTGLNYIYGSIVTFKCNAGYRMTGDASRKCQTDGKWSGIQPRCELVNCGNPGIPLNGERIGSDTKAGSEFLFECKPGFKIFGATKLTCQDDGTWSASIPSCAVSSCGSLLHGPSGSLQSPNYPNPYGNNQYCRWKIVVPVNKKVMIRFKSLDSELKKDWVLVSDPKTQTLITALSGINANEMLFTSSSNEMEVKFTSDDARESTGFEASYEQVSCGGIITNLNSVIQTPGYPNNYPDGTTCVWQVILPGKQISLNFDDFRTQQGYDFLKVSNRVDKFNDLTLLARFSGFLGFPTPLSSFGGYMHIIFSSNAGTSYEGFRAKITKYLKTYGK